MESIQGFGDDIHRGVITKGNIGATQVIIDRFWHTDHRHPLLLQRSGNFQGPVTTNGNQRLDAKIVDIFNDFVREIHKAGFTVLFYWVSQGVAAIAGSQNRASAWQDATDRAECQLSPTRCANEAIKTVFNTNNTPVASQGGTTNNTANNCIQTGAVTTSGQDRYGSTHKSLPDLTINDYYSPLPAPCSLLPPHFFRCSVAIASLVNPASRARSIRITTLPCRDS